MPKVAKERCKDLVGKRVRLVRPIETRGGKRYEKGTPCRVGATWRGRYKLESLHRVGGGGWSSPAWAIYMVHRADFELLE